jgi:tetrahydromethanopterin S-methyltransferase subunit A
LEALEAQVYALVGRNAGPFSEERDAGEATLLHRNTGREGDDPRFVLIRPGGKREPLAYDPKGFFIITLDRTAGEIILRHYLPDNSLGHAMRSRSAEGMLLGLLREGLISQLSHAGYLGAELAKAEAALRLGLHYEQDQPLRR